MSGSKMGRYPALLLSGLALSAVVLPAGAAEPLKPAAAVYRKAGEALRHSGTARYLAQAPSRAVIDGRGDLISHTPDPEGRPARPTMSERDEKAVRPAPRFILIGSWRS